VQGDRFAQGPRRLSGCGTNSMTEGSDDHDW
jgi:hypothetical protein